MPEIGPHDGYVIDRMDPKGVGRVKAILPGVVDAPTGWLVPLGASKGDGKGDFNPPDLNAEVCVFFLRGNPENGRYITGHWGLKDGGTEVPENAVVTSAGDNKVFDDGVFHVERDTRVGSMGFRVSHSDGTTVMEYDATTRRLKIHATSAIEIEATAEVKISGAQVTINNRVVMPTPDPI